MSGDSFFRVIGKGQVRCSRLRVWTLPWLHYRGPWTQVGVSSRPWGLTPLCVSGIPLAGRGASSGGRHPPFFRGVPRSLGAGPGRHKRQGAFSFFPLRKRPLSHQVSKNSLVFSWELKDKAKGVTRRWCFSHRKGKKSLYFE